MPKQRILVVEDDAVLARVLRDNLLMEGFDVECVGDGRTALSVAKAVSPDLVLLDITLPGVDGFELCRTWRQGRGIPVIMLTARAQKADKLRGLSLGADDYVTKPFDREELLARIHAVLRRTRPTIDRITLGPVTIDFLTCRAWTASGPVDLTHREFELLRYLGERSGTVVPRHVLLRDVWGYVDSPNTRAVDQAVARLRRKLEVEAHDPKFILTGYGDGYCLLLDGSSAPAE